MYKKYFISLILAFMIFLSCSYSFAKINNTNAKNALMNAGNDLGEAAVSTKNAVVSGIQDIGNGIGTIGNDAMNTMGTMENDSANTFSTAEGNYVATKTATTTSQNLFGLSDTAWTWVILGIIGAIIVGLVWYYGMQYEHRNYNHE